ncbi:MAG: type II secretion system protein, partial [Candidatus Peregrinibacteria bacterium]|nr:type II secretion system protein [Candidatus Peregrinibacteria bacterium]
MKLSHHPAFTFVELLIVITILSILSVMALIDYGFSIKKARLQVATAEVVALMQEAQVKAQTSYSQEDESGNEYVVCWGVVVSSSDAPMMVQVLWNEEDQTCSSDTADWEEADSLFWGETMGIARIEWESVSS